MTEPSIPSGPPGEPSAGDNAAHIRGDYVAGDKNISQTAGGDIVGRDKYVGLNVEELIAALRQAFPFGDSRPERLLQLLDEFREYHARLHEWKELHNALNNIIDAFDQYATRVESSYIEKNPLKPSVYREAWRPVNRRVEEMLEWAQTIEHIGQRYQALAGDRLEGERWAVDVKARRDDLMVHFERGQAVEQGMSGQVFQRLFQTNHAYEWLQRLYSLTHEFEDAIKRYMSQADNRLRETASDLYALSKQALGSQP